MFTGIIEEIGVVLSVFKAPSAVKLTISARKVLEGLRKGDSIAVNGVCLTTTEVKRGRIDFDVVEETIKSCELGALRIGDRVNLERAMLLGNRLGGHVLSGHIDGVGEVKDKIIKKDGFELLIAVPRHLLKYIAHKGSIAIDGVSLTVADIRQDSVKIAIVPHTALSTVLEERSTGSKVNIEVDLLAKYLERLNPIGNKTAIDDDFLMRTAFMPMGQIEN